MRDLSLIEAYYRKCMKNLPSLVPEGIYFLDLPLLHRLDLLHFQPGKRVEEPLLAHRFSIVESSDKLTLINDEFVVWIVSGRMGDVPGTYLLIALNHAHRMPRLEVVVVISGIYNAAGLALKVLERFLGKIRETERILSGLSAEE